MCGGVATNDNSIEGNKETRLKCEIVRQPKHVVHVLGRNRIGQINADNNTNYYDMHEVLTY